MSDSAPTITSRDVPQATSLLRVREAVSAIVGGAVDVATVADSMHLVERLTRYYVDAARTLGWVAGEDGGYSATLSGQWLASTPQRSDTETKAFAEAIRRSLLLQEIAPDLLDRKAPHAETITARIQERTTLGHVTARRRAQALLAWRRHAMMRSVETVYPLFPELERPVPPTSPSPSAARSTDPRTTITGVRLERFKGFRDAQLGLGHFTLIVGTNASGKSNVRDAMRFLHGVGRGYAISETIGEKWAEGGVLQWKGIRGGVREAAFQGAQTFKITVDLRIDSTTGQYEIEVDVGSATAGDGVRPPRVTAERLVVDGKGQYIFDSHPEKNAPEQTDHAHLGVRLKKPPKSGFIGPSVDLLSSRPALSQVLELREATADVRRHAASVLGALRSMRFLDLAPDALRLPSVPGQVILGDRGENLSSVLLAICDDASKKGALIEWVRSLTPLDVTDLEFVPDAQGKVLVTLVERNGIRTSAHSASDGTLRFLAMLAAFMGPEPAQLFFFEELDTGLHPARLHLLLDLIRHQTERGHLQVVATTHSPQLLGTLDDEALEHAVLTYRQAGHAEQEIKRVLALPRVADVLKRQDLARLHSSGFLEDVIALTAEPIAHAPTSRRKKA